MGRTNLKNSLAVSLFVLLIQFAIGQSAWAGAVVYLRRQKMKGQSILVVVMVATILVCSTGVEATVVMDWVTVGNPGNANDDTGYGGVSYVYRVSTYEVTAGQYTEFLNAVAATDTYGLYNTYMWSSGFGCKIQQAGSSGSYTYSIASDYANRPVNYVGWYDALRFANWLHNGQGTGDTEDGAYDMSLGSSVVRKDGAMVWLPSEDEWYKAAYHKNDGVTDNYWSYPTSSDSVPSNDLVEPTDPGNNATFYDWGYTIGSPYYRTEVGAHENSDSPYGTFDMGGNVHEWTESLYDGSYRYRSVRGGSSNYHTDRLLRSSTRTGNTPDNETIYVGFRVASVPEPAFEVEVEITPHTLNVQSKGKWITCHVWMPEGYDVTDVSSDSVLLEDEIPADWIWFDEEQQVIMVKFSRSALQELLADIETPAEVELVVSGELSDGTIFEGTDTIRVIDKGKRRNNSPGRAGRRVILKRKLTRD
jgi:formylglycine-generating enzyme required for sulfatase activity